MELNPKEIDAKFAALIEQRNSAMNQVVNMAAVIATQAARIEELESLISIAEAAAPINEEQINATDS